MGSNNITEIKRIREAYGISKAEARQVYHIISANHLDIHSFIDRYPTILSWGYRRVFVPDDVKDHLRHMDIDLDGDYNDHNVISLLGVDNNVSRTHIRTVNRMIYALYDMETRPTEKKAL